MTPPGGFPLKPPRGRTERAARITCGLPCEGKPTSPVTWPYHGPGGNYGPDRWHWHVGYRNWSSPVVYSDGYGTCAYYGHMWRTVYVPGFGLERAIVKVCEVI